MDSLSEGIATLGRPACKFLHLVQKIANRKRAVKHFSCCVANPAGRQRCSAAWRDWRDAAIGAHAVNSSRIGPCDHENGERWPGNQYCLTPEPGSVDP